ncbi:MAG TPA: hypothetical protein VGC13_21145 [Longimicrobium sp.]|jgi:hypothetical protein|uniref:hypothetical protein n=1 Tax=Longimicrobium sp. TaxID=2029185 RepID=UPI002EDA1080
MKRNVTRGVLAAVFAAAMGFGAAQAVAAPADAAPAAACNQDVCTQKCAQDGLVGICSGRGCYCR